MSVLILGVAPSAVGRLVVTYVATGTESVSNSWGAAKTVTASPLRTPTVVPSEKATTSLTCLNSTTEATTGEFDICVTAIPSKLQRRLPRTQYEYNSLAQADVILPATTRVEPLRLDTF